MWQDKNLVHLLWLNWVISEVLCDVFSEIRVNGIPYWLHSSVQYQLWNIHPRRRIKLHKLEIVKAQKITLIALLSNDLPTGQVGITADQREVFAAEDNSISLPKEGSWVAIEITTFFSPAHFYATFPFGTMPVIDLLNQEGSNSDGECAAYKL